MIYSLSKQSKTHKGHAHTIKKDKRKKETECHYEIMQPYIHKNAKPILQEKCKRKRRKIVLSIYMCMWHRNPHTEHICLHSVRIFYVSTRREWQIFLRKKQKWKQNTERKRQRVPCELESHAQKPLLFIYGWIRLQNANSMHLEKKRLKKAKGREHVRM